MEQDKVTNTHTHTHTSSYTLSCGFLTTSFPVWPTSPSVVWVCTENIWTYQHGLPELSPRHDWNAADEGWIIDLNCRSESDKSITMVIGSGTLDCKEVRAFVGVLKAFESELGQRALERYERKPTHKSVLDVLLLVERNMALSWQEMKSSMKSYWTIRCASRSLCRGDLAEAKMPCFVAVQQSGSSSSDENCYHFATGATFGDLKTRGKDLCLRTGCRNIGFTSDSLKDSLKSWERLNISLQDEVRMNPFGSHYKDLRSMEQYGAVDSEELPC